MLCIFVDIVSSKNQHGHLYPFSFLLPYHHPYNELKIAAVKNRFGPHAADGKTYATLNVSYGACQISDKNAYGAMLANDARHGYTGNYIPEDEYGNEIAV